MLYIILSIAAVIAVYFLKDMKKSSAEITQENLYQKFKLITDTLNASAFNGKGRVVPLNIHAFNLYKEGENQLLHFASDADTLTISWRYKHLKKEVKHEKVFHNISNISATEQEKMALQLIDEMRTVIENMNTVVVKPQSVYANL